MLPPSPSLGRPQGLPFPLVRKHAPSHRPDLTAAPAPFPGRAQSQAQVGCFPLGPLEVASQSLLEQNISDGQESKV